MKKRKATLFNNYFHSVFSSVVNTEHLLSHEGFLDKMDEIEISYDGILNLVHGLKLNKASGPDGIPDRVLTSCSGIISSYLEVLFKKSLSSGRLLSQWKTANVVPIHKRGPKSTSITTDIFPSFVRAPK